MTGLEPSLVKSALELLELAKKDGWLDKLKSILKKRSRVIVLGSTGVGKTNLLEALTKPLPKVIDSINRSEFARKHKVSITAEPFEFIDTPGQEFHDSRRMAAIRQAMARGPVGVLNVVSYGYHEYAVARSDVFDGNGKIQSGFLDRHRRIEIETLNQWTALLGDTETAKWLITVASKADLWWDERDAVMAHYTKGDYFKALGPAKVLKPVTVEFASVVHLFYGRGAVSGVFDDEIRKSLRTRLLTTLLHAAGK